jgi:hypothetical protein
MPDSRFATNSCSTMLRFCTIRAQVFRIPGCVWESLPRSRKTPKAKPANTIERFKFVSPGDATGPKGRPAFASIIRFLPNATTKLPGFMPVKDRILALRVKVREIRLWQPPHPAPLPQPKEREIQSLVVVLKSRPRISLPFRRYFCVALHWSFLTVPEHFIHSPLPAGLISPGRGA